ncbi:hypothetical protein B0H11DRAFT_2254776 [Mycena galericulata]|nr:hypothetical protein B0H11DRAFT_2254776 [Mycena galericulata]
MDVSGVSWDSSIYVGLRQFHEAKGFDPDSQDAALHLGHPLLKCPDVEGPLVPPVDDKDSGTENDGTNPPVWY